MVGTAICLPPAGREGRVSAAGQRCARDAPASEFLEPCGRRCAAALATLGPLFLVGFCVALVVEQKVLVANESARDDGGKNQLRTSLTRLGPHRRPSVQLID